MKKIRKYRPFLRAGFMDLFAYKAALFSWFFVSFLQVLFTLVLWQSVYKNSPNGTDSIIYGFSFKEIIVYQVYINILNFIVIDNTTSSYMMDEIREGTIANFLIKPISYRLRFTFMITGNFIAITLLLALPAYLISTTIFVLTDYIEIVSIGGFLLRILLFIVSAFLACLLNDSLNFMLGTTLFYTNSSFGLNQIKEIVIRFLSGSMIPIAFFPKVMQKIIGFLPFASMGENPVLIFMGKVKLLTGLRFILIEILFIVILEIINKLYFKHAIKKVTVQGG